MSIHSTFPSLLLVFTLAACGPETVGGEGSESESGGQEDDLCGGWSLSAELVGSMSMPGACDNFVFTGTLLEQPSAGTWNLDSCPCDAACESPDPYTLTTVFSGEGAPELPDMPACPQIEIYRDAQCDVVSVLVRDLDNAGAPVWWGTTPDTLIPGFEWLQSQLQSEQLCSDGDDDGPIVTGHAIRYGVGGVSTPDLGPGESAMLTDTPVGTIEIHNGNADSVQGEDVVVSPSYVVIVQ